VTPRKIEIRDGKIAGSIDAKLAGETQGRKFIISAEEPVERGARNAERGKETE
jgi:hypothetical protein